MILLGHIGPSIGVGALWGGLRLGRAALLWVAACAILPDLVDKPLHMLGLAPAATGRLWGHTLLFSLLWCLACRRWIKPLWPWALATPGHLILDGMWERLHTLFWPLLGNIFDLPEQIFPNYWQYWRWLFHNEPWTLAWLLAWEALGLCWGAWVLRSRLLPLAAPAGAGAAGLPQR